MGFVVFVCLLIVVWFRLFVVACILGVVWVFWFGLLMGWFDGDWLFVNSCVWMVVAYGCGVGWWFNLVAVWVLVACLVLCVCVCWLLVVWCVLICICWYWFAFLVCLGVMLVRVTWCAWWFAD